MLQWTYQAMKPVTTSCPAAENSPLLPLALSHAATCPHRGPVRADQVGMAAVHSSDGESNSDGAISQDINALAIEEAESSDEERSSSNSAFSSNNSSDNSQAMDEMLDNPVVIPPRLAARPEPAANAESSNEGISSSSSGLATNSSSHNSPMAEDLPDNPILIPRRLRAQPEATADSDDEVRASTFSGFSINSSYNDNSPVGEDPLDHQVVISPRIAA